MIIENPDYIQEIYEHGTMNMKPYKKAYHIGITESILLILASFLLCVFSRNNIVFYGSFIPLIVGIIYIIYCNSPRMIVRIIRKSDTDKTFSKVQNILHNADLKPEDIVRMLIVPEKNSASLHAGVYVETDDCVRFYSSELYTDNGRDFYPVPEDNTVYWKKGVECLIYISTSYAIRDGEIYYAHRNYYKEILENAQKKRENGVIE